MLGFFDALLLLFILFVMAAAYWYATIPKNLPPGPLGLPFLGSAYEYRQPSDQHLITLEQIKKYGPVFKLYIANKLVVVLGDFDTIQEALVKQGDAFAGRPQMHALLPEMYRYKGLFLSEGELWKEQRRFALSTLRDFGIGRPIIEPKIQEEIDHLSERIQEYTRTGSPMDPKPLLTCATANIISQLIFGRRFNYDDPEFLYQFTKLSERLSGTVLGPFSPVMVSDWIASFLQYLPIMCRIQKDVDSFIDYTKHQKDETAKSFDPESDPTNYVHAFMKAAHKNQGSYFTDAQLLTSVGDLFIAGSESTSTTVRYGILFLATHPEVQERMYREIKDQVGTSSLPNYADRIQLPFCEAVIMETQRFGNLTPFGTNRRSLQATKLMGYDIPEDTIVVPFLMNVLMNPEVYPNADKFDPTRFLDSDGKVIRDPKLIPFLAGILCFFSLSIGFGHAYFLGKRMCLGEPLARIELFLLMVGLVSRFRFYFTKDQKPDMKPIVGVLSQPAPYEVYVEARND